VFLTGLTAQLGTRGASWVSGPAACGRARPGPRPRPSTGRWPVVVGTKVPTTTGVPPQAPGTANAGS